MLAAGQIKASAITAKKRASDLVQGETFCMGRWPQSEVTSSSLLNALNKLSVSLWTYEYKYEASESSYKVIDMSFGDVAYGGEVYRKVVINQYRPCRTSASSSSSNSEQFDNGYYVGNTYWFRWDPINWVTIKIESDGVYVMSELLLDSQPYNDIFTSVNWEKCTIRKWLAKTFFQSAFSNKEKNCVLDYQRSSAVKDKIWLVSSTELSYSNLPGFFKDMKTSNYAKSQGLCVIIDDYNEESFYWWRSFSNNDFYKNEALQDFSFKSKATLIYDAYRSVNYTDLGIRPAFKINPSSILSGSADPADVGRIFHGSLTDTSDIVEKSYGNGEDYLNKTVFFKENKNDTLKSALLSFKKEWVQSNQSYNHDLARFCSLYSMFGYSPDNSTKSTNNTYINSCLKDGGFTVLDSNMNAARDEVNYFIAAKTVKLGGTKRNILFVGTIGSNKEQWYSNFDPEGRGRKNGKGRETGKHCGFEDAKDFMVKKINGILSNEKYGFTQSNTILLFTGHSRGAATANLLAASAINENKKWANNNRIFAYTFATPNCTLAKDYNASKYSFIHNIVNPEDMVTHVMMKDSWKYHKYGNIYVLPSKTNTSSAKYKSYLTRMNHFYKNYKNDEYEPYTRGEAATHKIIQEFNKNMKSVGDFYSKKYYYKGVTWLEPYEFFKKTLLPYVANVSKESKDEGYDNMIDVLLWNPLGFYFDIVAYFADPDIDFSNQHGYELGMGGNFEQAHAMHTYCSYMQALNFDEITAKRNSKYGSWNCPVDIEIYDNTTNELVGRIKNNIVDKEIEAKENSVVMTVDGDTKSYYLPTDGDYTVKIIGNDDGTANYTLSTLNEDFNEVDRVNYFKIPVEEAVAMTSDVEPKALTQNIQLLDANKAIIDYDEYFVDAQDAIYNVSVDVTGSGFVTGDGEAKSGDYVQLSATAQCSEFQGWYVGESLVSRNEQYTLHIKGDVSLNAKFTQGNHSFEEVTTEATCVNSGITANVCSKCGLTNIISETPALGHNLTEHKEKRPTCTEVGWEAYQTCSKCNYSTYCELPAFKHTFKNDIIKPTGISLGYTLYTCLVCDKRVKDTYTAPKGKQKIKCKARTASAQTIIWNNVKTATGYQVQISTKDGKKWSTYATLKAGVTNYTFKKLAAGNNYKFRVRFYINAADGKKYFSPWSTTLNSPTLPSGTKISKLTAGKKSFTAHWKKAGFSGYQIQYCTNLIFSKPKTLTVKNAKTLKATFKKLSAKKIYYVRIRTYNTISKVNYFSDWSKVYKIKTK